MEEGWTSGISRARCMSSTSGRSFGRLFVLTGVLVSDPASCNNRAKGSVDRSESSMSISFEDSEEFEAAEDLRRRFGGRVASCAHSGTEFRRSNCRRSRLVYSFPLTTSSPSFIRSFRRRGFPARDIVNRSSSLSSHAGAPPSFPSSSSEGPLDISAS
jgi:hypothetical protein